MKVKKWMSLGALSLATGVFLPSVELNAWQKATRDDCTQQTDRDSENCRNQQAKCMKNPNNSAQCKKDFDKCQMESKNRATRCETTLQQQDDKTFASSLNYTNKKKYQNFTPDQKKTAMDYADNNNMSPDDAVTKVGS